MSILLVWGGMVAVRPSPAQKRIAGLRQFAIERGLRIRLGSQLKLGLSRDLSDLVAYVKFRQGRVKDGSGVLLRNPESGQVQHSSGCFRHPDDRLDRLLESLPEGCALLASSAAEVLIGWGERGDAADVERIIAALDELQEWTSGQVAES